MQRRQSLFAFVVLCVAVVLSASSAVAQINTATLSGIVTDPQGLAVRGAKISVTLLATGAERSTTVDDAGRYNFVGLVPGIYKLRTESGGFAPYENPSMQLTVGEQATFNIKLELGTQSQTVTVTTESTPVETTRTETSQTVDERHIDNLPINGRNYINFTETNSQTLRDNSNAIGPAPNSGLSITGSRARSNMVSIDGADAVDNSVNGIRPTISQEGVQEFQLILGNYNAEYGRATGGVINIVTKSGGNEFHGDVFGYLRNKSFQARNPFSGEVDPATGNLIPTKQAYTRVQTGAAFGGPIRKDKTFYFFSYEYTQREETGFSSIGQSNFGFTTGNVECIANPATFAPIPLSMTASQLASYNAVIGAITGNNPLNCINPALQSTLQPVLGAAVATGAATNVAVTGHLNQNIDRTMIPMTSLLGYPAPVVMAGVDTFFPAPVTCPAGQLVNNIQCSGTPVPGTVGAGLVPLPASYTPLDDLRGNFPVHEKTSLWSARIDQRWNARNSSFIRVGVSPTLSNGVQSTSQNQVLGQNAGSRVGLNQSRDVNATFQHDTILSDTAFNEFRFQFARRGVHFGYSDLPGGSSIGVNIPGIAYFGREPYSPVDRIERRFQFSDNATITRGRHTFKVGVDANLIQLRSKKQQIFQLDFGGDVTFGGFSLAPGLPAVTDAQAYGLGDPTVYIQGIGNSNSPFENLPFAFFGQDTWRVTPKLTVNYGVRYDFEITPLFAPATAINAAAEKALGVVEGLPRDYRHVAPRVGIAWDPAGDGKTVIRAGYGLFYDHPLLAIAFDATTADGGRSVQLLSTGSTPSACGLLPGTNVCGGSFDSPANLNGSSIFQGALNAQSIYPAFPTSLTLGYLPNEQRFDPFAANSLFANQNYLNVGFPLPILPFTLPVDKNFRYGYAQQVNLTVERSLGGTWKLSVGYQGTRGLHLNRPGEKDPTDPVLLTTNLQNADAAGLGFLNPLSVVVQDRAPAGPSAQFPAGTCGLTTAAPGLVPGVLGALFGCPAAIPLDGKLVGTSAFFNFFRPTGPNPSFATGLGLQVPQCSSLTGTALFNCGYSVQQALANAAGFPVGLGVPVPFNGTDAQESDAASWYNALTVNLQKTFSRHITLLSSYTWSHSIDNGTDLQTTLLPQDPRFFNYERGNSVNDQRHRWVTSGVFQTSPHKPGESFVNNFLSNFTVAPLIEWSSGRPYNIISNEDFRVDFSAFGVRPDLGGGTTSPFIHGASFGLPSQCFTNAKQPFTVTGVTPPFGCFGTLGRDRFNTPGFAEVDLRVSKGINFGERFRVDLIADIFNLANHTNIAAVNQVCDPSAGSTCLAGQPSAAFDARQFQFALKLSW
ncbi:MAG TPA: TonB-dependent receptor [Candidatus Acidoferrum sp.]|nr:TonB-dependent receptor [Candidatus Acidoferrum sp.]